jgi:hypothetical protein
MFFYLCLGGEEEGLGSGPMGLQMKRHSTPATLMWMDQHYHLAEVTKSLKENAFFVFSHFRLFRLLGRVVSVITNSRNYA